MKRRSTPALFPSATVKWPISIDRQLHDDTFVKSDFRALIVPPFLFNFFRLICFYSLFQTTVSYGMSFFHQKRNVLRCRETPHPAASTELFLPSLLDYGTLELRMNRVRSLLSMRRMLLGYSFEPRPNSLALAIAGQVMTIGHFN